MTGEEHNEKSKGHPQKAFQKDKSGAVAIPILGTLGFDPQPKNYRPSETPLRFKPRDSGEEHSKGTGAKEPLVGRRAEQRVEKKGCEKSGEKS